MDVTYVSCVCCMIYVLYVLLCWRTAADGRQRELGLQGFQVSTVDLEDGKVFSRHLERGGWSLGNPGRDLRGL